MWVLHNNSNPCISCFYMPLCKNFKAQCYFLWNFLNGLLNLLESYISHLLKFCKSIKYLSIPSKFVNFV